MDNLRILRKQRNLSQQRLADILHISQQSVYKYENAITTPDIETLISIADFFDTSVDYLIGHTDISHKIEPITDCSLNSDEKSLIQKYQTLPPSNRNLIHKMVDELLKNANLRP